MEHDIFEYIRLNYWSILSPTEEQRQIFRKCQNVSSLLNVVEFVGKDALSVEEIQALKIERDLVEGDIEFYTEELMWQTLEAHMRRIYDEKRNELFFLRCPICGTLARTPIAKQAKCGHRWG